MPQDNIHTGEVTLHELNILHDGIDLTGPLRLRLSSIPRFITRYHALREQVAQLSLASGLDGGVHPEGDQPEDESPEHANGTPPSLLDECDYMLTSLPNLQSSLTPKILHPTLSLRRLMGKLNRLVTKIPSVPLRTKRACQNCPLKRLQMLKSTQLKRRTSIAR